MSRTRLRQEWFRVRLGFAVGAALVVLAGSGPLPQPITAQEGMRGRSEAGDLECISYCSTTRPGVVIMEVKLRLADQPLNEVDLRSGIQQQGLEVTVYGEGFERGLYATVLAIKPKALFRPRRKGDGLAPAVQTQSKIPGLEKLVITDVATRLEKSAESFHLMQPNLRGTSEGEWVMFRLEGVDPLLAYTYRVPGGRSAVTCLAVACPVDRIPAQANPAKRKPKNSR